ncbi:uncharacterized protein [Choristoneura fumiferana]|uniref:uncharacterized protein n=1 Tax=Choristoneura fumiferana TaxID=7141 RepID=UPI003D15CA15
MSTEDRLLELEAELQRVKWDILGLCEVRREGEELITLPSGNLLYYKEGERKGMGGVGFLVNKEIKDRVLEIGCVTNRVAYAKIRLSSKYTLAIIQVYAPTSSSTDDKVEDFYENITKASRQCKSHYNLVIGDFNARVGNKESGVENCMGEFGLGERNIRGSALVNYALQHNLFIMNTFFAKKPQRKWTWRHPDGIHKNEYDYILSNRRDFVHDVSVLNNFTTGSDHRLVRATLAIDLKTERRKLTRKHISRDVAPDIIRANFKEYQQYVEDHLANYDRLRLLSIEELNKHLTTIMIEALEKVTPRDVNFKPKKLTEETIKLMERRRELRTKNLIDTPEYSSLQNNIRQKIKTDLIQYQEAQITKAIERNTSKRVLRAQISKGRKEIFQLLDERGNVVTNRENLLEVTKTFYENLYKSKVQSSYLSSNVQIGRSTIANVGSEEIPDVTIEEVQLALRQVKNRRSPGQDNIIPEMLKLGSADLWRAIALLFTNCILDGRVPSEWHNAVIILLHKKGDIRKLDNYRPISLLSHMYKLFTRVIMNRLSKKLDDNQPREQAGFRSGFGTNDHLQTLKTVIEKCHEYNKPIIITFVDYEKAFDSVEAWAVEGALADCRVDERYIQLIKHLQQYATSSVCLHKLTKPFKLERGVRQGDTISPKLFNAALENIFRGLDWSNKGLVVDGERLSHLRFADDIALITDNVGDMVVMIDELQRESLKIGLKMNVTKTKIMTNIPPGAGGCPLPFEVVSSYVYLGHRITLGSEDQVAEIERRIAQAWAAFGANKSVLQSRKIRQHLKTKIFNQCVLPVFTYGMETTTLTEKSAEKLRVAQRAMERSMLGITVMHRKRNEWIRRVTKVRDVVEEIERNKWRWAGHIARMNHDRWARRTLEWRPRENTRSRGRPPMRWKDDICRQAGGGWMHMAVDRQAWRNGEEAYGCRMRFIDAL